MLTAGGGTEERGFGSLVTAGSWVRRLTIGYMAGILNRSGLVDRAGGDANDGQQALRGGGRINAQLTDRDRLMVEGDLYHRICARHR